MAFERFERVTNTRLTKSGVRMELVQDDEDYILKTHDWAYGGPIMRQYRMSKDDVKALYLMLDDIVGTF